VSIGFSLIATFVFVASIGFSLIVAFVSVASIGFRLIATFVFVASIRFRLIVAFVSVASIGFSLIATYVFVVSGLLGRSFIILVFFRRFFLELLSSHAVKHSIADIKIANITNSVFFIFRPSCIEKSQ